MTIAPDLPGFDFTTVDFDSCEFSFANGALVLSRFLDALAVKIFAMYIFDFGAPWAFASGSPASERRDRNHQSEWKLLR
jgi:hypothetical protein